MRPPSRLTASQWADQYYRAPRGKFRVSAAEYQRGILDAISDPRNESVVVMASAQVGKTECELIGIGYFAHQDPSSVLVVVPTVDTAKAWSKERLSTAIKLNPVLSAIFPSARSKVGDNTLLTKSYPGGLLALVGANSPVGLSSRPMRIVLGDEIDRWPLSAGTEGDPMDLASKRTQTYWNRKLIWVSTPTIRGISRIDRAYLESDQRKYYVHCPHCGTAQVLAWENVKWTELNLAPEEAVYQCPHCQGIIKSSQKQRLLKGGYWQAHAPFKGSAGFHISELYSPWSTFGSMAVAFLKAKDNRQSLQVWINTALGEPFEDYEAEDLDWQLLAKRPDSYLPLTVPAGGLILTAGVDVQADRLALVVRAWGRGEESWLVYWQELWGDPHTDVPWNQLTEILGSSFDHESGAKLKIKRTSVDSSAFTHEVYRYVRRARRSLDVIPIKGYSVEHKPILSRPTAQDVTYEGKTVKNGVQLWMIGVDTAKDTISARLKMEAPGGGFYHFPKGVADQYYEELCGEHLITKFNAGVPKRVWAKIAGKRNEALDCEVYAYHAALSLGIDNPRWDWDKFDPAIIRQTAGGKPANDGQWVKDW